MTSPSAHAPAWTAELDPVAWAVARARLERAICDHERVVIAGHIRPDGDALGSVLALHHALGRAGARTVPVIGEHPLRLEAGMARLPGIAEVRDATTLPAAAAVDLLVTVDAASPARLGAVARYLDAGVETVVYDHHARREDFGDVTVNAPEAAATVLLLARLLDELALPFDPEVADALYVGLVTDTGRFSYAATDPSALQLAARLLEAGVDQATWTQALYETRPLAELAVLGTALARAQLHPEVALVATHLEADELAGATAEGLIDLVRTVEGAEVALTLLPEGPGTWKGSLRSRGRADVGRIAAALGGGGHRLAAGFTASGTPAALTERVVSLLAEG
ncbi:MAG: DHH family phosphoesterase [Nitriliruptoraceae bacterium]